jgi:hypothetical protein
MRFFFRKPVFPILVDTGTELVVLRTAGEGSRLARLVEPGARPLDVIDARVEGFAYYPQHDIITPLAMKKNWRKAEIITLYNSCRHALVHAQPREPQARAGVRGCGGASTPPPQTLTGTHLRDGARLRRRHARLH